MDKLFERIALRFSPGCDKPKNELARARVGLLEGLVSIVMNIFLAVIKAILATLTGSLSLLADAFHTFADSLTSAIVIIGFRLSRKPADAEHPFGHGRIESIASLIIGVLLAITAIELGRAAIERLLDPQPVQAPTWIIVVVAFTAIAKEFLARFSFTLGRLIKSNTLEADAWHHRSDVFATGLVVVAFIAARFGVLWLDGVAGLGVSALLVWAAYEIITQAAAPLMGEPVDEEVLHQVHDKSLAVDGVLGVHEIVMQKFGARSVLSLHIELAREKSVVEAHEISHEVEHLLEDELNAHVTVHVDPRGEPHPEFFKIRTIIQSELNEMSTCTGHHDIRLSDVDDNRLQVEFDVTTTSDFSTDEKTACYDRIKQALISQYPEADVVIHFDPPFCAEVCVNG